MPAAPQPTQPPKPSKPLGMRRQPSQRRSQERVAQILQVAEEMFISEGYNSVTTNAIASRAQVPIGSLYQFFPDKGAIVQALALQYMQALRERFVALHNPAANQLPLPGYVDAVIEATVQFFQDYPGYHAIFTQVQGLVPELSEIEAAADSLLIQDWAEVLSATRPGLLPEDYYAIAFTLVQAIGMLLWLSLSQKPAFQARLVDETRRLMLGYLQGYLGELVLERL